MDRTDLSAHIQTHTGTFKGNSRQRERSIERPEIKFKDTLAARRNALTLYHTNAIIMQLRVMQRRNLKEDTSPQAESHKRGRMLCKNAPIKFSKFSALGSLLSFRQLVGCSYRRKNTKVCRRRNVQRHDQGHSYQTPLFASEHTRSCVMQLLVYQCIRGVYICRLPYNAAICGANGRDHRRRSP